MTDTPKTAREELAQVIEFRAKMTEPRSRHSRDVIERMVGLVGEPATLSQDDPGNPSPGFIRMPSGDACSAHDATIAELRNVLTRLLNAQDKLWPYNIHAPSVQQPLPVSFTMKIPSDEQIEHTKATADARKILKDTEPK
jgi:hypothetical protein